MTLEENESHVIVDYGSDEVRIFTTRRGVANAINERLKGVKDKFVCIERETEGDITWRFKIPIEYCRDAQYITKTKK